MPRRSLAKFCSVVERLAVKRSFFMMPKTPFLRLLPCLTGVVLLLVSQAALAKEPVLKWGLGVRSCAKFAKQFGEDPQLWETLYYIWAEGYMTGFEMARSSLRNRSTDLNPYNRDEQWRRESSVRRPLI